MNLPRLPYEPKAGRQPYQFPYEHLRFGSLSFLQSFYIYLSEPAQKTVPIIAVWFMLAAIKLQSQLYCVLRLRGQIKLNLHLMSDVLRGRGGAYKLKTDIVNVVQNYFHREHTFKSSSALLFRAHATVELFRDSETFSRENWLLNFFKPKPKIKVGLLGHFFN